MRVRVRRALDRVMPVTLTRLTRDAWLLFLTRFLRLFAYGSLSVVLVFYLIGLGLSEVQTGMLLTLTLAGDTVVSLLLTTRADRIGRRRMLVAGALLMAAAGLVFAGTSNLVVLLLAGIVGVISPSGNEVGPFLPIEQAALTHVVPDRGQDRRVRVVHACGRVWHSGRARCLAASRRRRCNSGRWRRSPAIARSC